MNELPAPRRRAAKVERGLSIDFGTTYEVSSFAPNPLLAGVGADPWGGTSSSFLWVPQQPTLSPTARYLFRLAALGVGSGESIELLGFRQGVQIGVSYPEGDERDPGDETQLLAIDQSTPTWSFPDGNVSWHITVWPGVPRNNRVAPAPTVSAALPGLITTEDYYGLQPGLLVRSSAESLYEPPGKGVPPGDPAGSLGNFWELRGTWLAQGTAASEGLLVSGPANIGFFATVRQTNPEREGRVALPTDLGSYMPPETRFVAAFPNARYTGVAGSLLVRKRCR